MAKKIRFPLVMADGAEVRSLDELQEHFDLSAMITYFRNGKLLTWLNDRYYSAEAEAVETLNESDSDFQQKLCTIFGVEYANCVDLDELNRRQERLAKLRTYTDEPEFIEHIDQVAFDQEELADLLDDGFNTIFLCGNSFSVPVKLKNKSYIGINDPEIRINSPVILDFASEQIRFEKVHFCEEYQRLIDASIPKEPDGIEQPCVAKGDLFSDEILEIQKLTKAWDTYICPHIWVHFETSFGELDNFEEEHCSKSRCKDLAQKVVRKVYNEGMSYLSSGSSRSASREALNDMREYAEDCFAKVLHHVRILADSNQALLPKLDMIKQLLDLDQFLNEVKRELDNEIDESYYSLYNFDYFLDRVEYTDDDIEMETGFMRLLEIASVSYSFNAFDAYQEIEKDTQNYVDSFVKNANRIICNHFRKRHDRIDEIITEMRKMR